MRKFIHAKINPVKIQVLLVFFLSDEDEINDIIDDAPIEEEPEEDSEDEGPGRKRKHG